MEKSDLMPVITRLCDLQLAQFKFNQELLLGSVAIQYLMEEQGHPDFRKAWQGKLRHLRGGELGQQIAQDIAAFGQEIQQLKSTLL